MTKFVEIESLEERLQRLVHSPLLNIGEKHFVKTIIGRLKDDTYNLNSLQIKKIDDLNILISKRYHDKINFG